MSNSTGGKSGRNVLDISRGKSSSTSGQKAASAKTHRHKRVLMKLNKPAKGPRLKTRRRRMRVIGSVVAVIAGVGLVAGFGYVSHVQELAITDIVVTGVQRLSPETVKTAVSTQLDQNLFYIFSQRNMFLYPKTAIEETLPEEFLRIEGVRVSRQTFLAQAITVAVTERAPFAQWCDDVSCYVLDDAGFVFARNDHEVPATSYIFEKGLIPGEDPIGQYFLRSKFNDVVAVLDSLGQGGYVVRTMRVENETDFSVRLLNGMKLLMSFDTDVETAMRNLGLALSSEAVRGREPELQYIDLRFGNRVYYKFVGEQ